jgi:transcriptional regulator with XRE-family HTH domain
MKEVRLLCEKIKQMRISKNITREQFAIETGIARSHIYRIEQAESSPSIKMLVRIAEVLGVPVKDLIEF